jgi:SH3 domain-containing protein
MAEAVFEVVFACTRMVPATALRRACATCLSILFLCGLCSPRSRDTAGASFSIDLDKPFADVLSAVSDVAHSGSIKGTFEYRDEEQLNGAQFEEKSQLFPVWSGPGKVLYKLRAKTLSPSHFLNSNDVGTVAVRYVVQELSPNSTRLFIDAVFIENARHHGHPSDGYVETCEFGEIGKRLKDRDQLQTQVAAGEQFSPGHESSSRPDTSPPANEPSASSAPSSAAAPVEVVDSAKLADLQRVIGEQRTLLASESAKLDQLEAQARQLRTSEFVRVKADRAELKNLPYAHARVVEALAKGQEVTVLSKSTYWYQVRSEDGKEGWISHASLEVQP